MKTIIVSEGHNDGLFWESLMAKLGYPEEKILFFSNENCSMDNKKHGETTVLNKFKDSSSYNKNEFLIKLEGGKGPAKKIFSRELINWMDQQYKIILLLDLDLCSNEQKIEEIKNFIEREHKENPPISINPIFIDKNNHLFHYSCKVQIIHPNQEFGTFELILFKKSLEASCDILKGDIDNEKLDKIKNFIEQEKIHRFFYEIFSS